MKKRCKGVVNGKNRELCRGNLIDLEKRLKNEYLIAKIGVDTAENEPFSFFLF